MRHEQTKTREINGDVVEQKRITAKEAYMKASNKSRFEAMAGEEGGGGE